MNDFLRVIKPGGMMHYQDLGRYGWSHLGVSQGGALDLHAHCWANYLLGNNADAVTIEITLGNVSWEVLEDDEISLTGAEMDAKLDGISLQRWRTHRVIKGQVLSLGYARIGCHAYLGVLGGFRGQQYLGSSSTVVRNDMGDWLKQGEVMLVHSDGSGVNINNRHASAKLTPGHFVPNYNETNVVRVLLAHDLDGDFRERFLGHTYKVSAESDRMGRRLEALGELPQLNGILSEGVSLGCIQLPPSGHPIVLLSDRQTQGGYAKVGNVARVDIPKFVQMQPGCEFKFIEANYDEVEHAWREFAQFFDL